MDNWQILCAVRAAVPGRAGWEAVEAVWALLKGTITRQEAESLLAGLVPDPEALLKEIMPCDS